jgi:hypothetical protein
MTGKSYYPISDRFTHGATLVLIDTSPASARDRPPARKEPRGNPPDRVGNHTLYVKTCALSVIKCRRIDGLNITRKPTIGRSLARNATLNGNMPHAITGISYLPDTRAV